MEQLALISAHFKPALSKQDADYCLTPDEIIEIIYQASSDKLDKKTVVDELTNNGYILEPFDQITHFEYKFLLKRI